MAWSAGSTAAVCSEGGASRVTAMTSAPVRASPWPVPPAAPTATAQATTRAHGARITFLRSIDRSAGHAAIADARVFPPRVPAACSSRLFLR
jgi:hypothetical protein